MKDLIKKGIMFCFIGYIVLLLFVNLAPKYVCSSTIRCQQTDIFSNSKHQYVDPFDYLE